MEVWGEPSREGRLFLFGEVTALAEHCEEHRAHERAIEVHDKRLDAHGSEIERMQVLLAKLTSIEEQNQARIDGHEARLAALESRPARRWDTAVTAALTALAGGLAGYMFAGAGLG